MKIKCLSVFMNGVLVGRVERHRTGTLSFTYDHDWLGRDRPIMISRRFPLQEKPFTGQTVRSYFDNLLPDDPRVRERLAASAQSAGTDSFDLLSSIGRDCVGALQFYPGNETPGKPGTVKGKPVSVREIEAILENLQVNPLGLSREHDFRISLAGAQSKTALLRINKKWLIPTGATPTTHILKPAIGTVTGGMDLSLSVENEWLCLKLLEAFELETARAEMADFGRVRALVVERFDRKWVGNKLYRLPQEDLCQALGVGPETKYESDGGPDMGAILGLLNESDQRDPDRHAFVKAQLVFWLLAAIDGHAKNFSIFLRPSGFALAPLYDVISADPLVSAKSLTRQKLKFAMSVGDGRHYRVQEILPRYWQQTAKKYKFTGIDDLMNEVAKQAPQAVERANKALPRGFPAKVCDPIFKGILERTRRLSAS